MSISLGHLSSPSSLRASHSHLTFSFDQTLKQERIKNDKADVWALRNEREKGRGIFADQQRELEKKPDSSSKNHRLRDIKIANKNYLNYTREQIENFCTILRGSLTSFPRDQIRGTLAIASLDSYTRSFLSLTDFYKFSNVNRAARRTTALALSINLKSQQRLRYSEIVSYATAFGFIPKEPREKRQHYHYRLTDKILEFIADKCLELKWIDFFPDVWVFHHLGQFAPIKHSITIKALSSLFMKCHSLETVSLEGCENLQTLTPALNFEAKLRLQHLNLTRCGLSEEGLRDLAPLPNLTYLDLTHNMDISEQALVVFLTTSPQLETLILADLPLTNASLQFIATYCPHLKYLSIRGCRQITAIGIRDFAAQYQKKEKFEIRTGELRSKDRIDLKNAYPNLKITTN